MAQTVLQGPARWTAAITHAWLVRILVKGYICPPLKRLRVIAAPGKIPACFAAETDQPTLRCPQQPRDLGEQQRLGQKMSTEVLTHLGFKTIGISGRTHMTGARGMWQPSSRLSETCQLSATEEPAWPSGRGCPCCVQQLAGKE